MRTLRAARRGAHSWRTTITPPGRSWWTSGSGFRTPAPRVIAPIWSSTRSRTWVLGQATCARKSKRPEVVKTRSISAIERKRARTAACDRGLDGQQHGRPQPPRRARLRPVSGCSSAMTPEVSSRSSRGLDRRPGNLQPAG